MNNLSNSMKKFLGNKNTVTILGFVLCCVILYVGYNYRINQKVELVEVPMASKTIQPRTLIDNTMIEEKKLPSEFLVGTYYKSRDDIVGKYSNYNTVIAAGSLFYTELVVEESALPSATYLDVDEGDTLIIYKVNMDSTYANSMMPGDSIKVYFKARGDSGEIMFGKFLDNVEILAMKDSSGRHVFENSAEARTPAYMLFALPEEMHLLFRKALYLSGSYGVELILVPNTQELKEEDAVMVTSKDIQDFINDKTEMVSVDQIMAETDDQVSNEQ